MQEIWKDIEDYKNYQVSNFANVRSKDMKSKNGSGEYIKKGRVLKQTKNSMGYLRVPLIDDFGNKKAVFVHRLVATYFVENEFNNTCVNHLDFNPLNNLPENLQWCTYEENYYYSFNRGRFKRTEQWLENLHKSQEKTYKSVVAINLKSNEVIFFKNLNSVKNKGFQPSCVCLCCKGKLKQHKGYKFKYYKEYIETLTPDELNQMLERWTP